LCCCTWRWTAGLARAELTTGKPEEAVPLAERAIHQMPACVPAHRPLIAALSCLGRSRAASTAVDRLHAAVPSAVHVSVQTVCRKHRNQGFAETLIQALRKTGMPEGRTGVQLAKTVPVRSPNSPRHSPRSVHTFYTYPQPTPSSTMQDTDGISGGS